MGDTLALPLPKTGWMSEPAIKSGDEKSRKTRRTPGGPAGPHVTDKWHWRPSPHVRLALKERAEAKGLAMTELVSYYVDLGLERDEMDEGISDSVAGEMMDTASALQGQVMVLRSRIDELTARVDALGPHLTAVPLIMAYWISRDPATWTAGETPEDAEERLLETIDESSTTLWSSFQFPVEPSGLESQPGEREKAAPVFERAVEWWRLNVRHARVARALEAVPEAFPESLARRERRAKEKAARAAVDLERTVGWRKYRFLERVAAGHACSPEVVHRALLDLAVTWIDDSRAVPAWAVDALRDEFGRSTVAMLACERAFDAIARRLDFLGEGMVSIPGLLVHWLVQDPAVAWALTEANNGRVYSKEELEEGIEEDFWEQAAQAWEGEVARVLDELRPDLRPPGDPDWMLRDGEVD